MNNKVLLLGSEGIGRGDEDLGKRVALNFLGTLLAKKALPKALFLVNSAVRLATSDSPAHDSLAELEKAGVRVLACTTCVKAFNLVDRIPPHRLSSMDALVDLMTAHEVISL